MNNKCASSWRCTRCWQWNTPDWIHCWRCGAFWKDVFVPRYLRKDMQDEVHHTLRKLGGSVYQMIYIARLPDWNGIPSLDYSTASLDVDTVEEKVDELYKSFDKVPSYTIEEFRFVRTAKYCRRVKCLPG